MKSFWIPPLSSAPTPPMPRTACSRPVSFPESAVPNLGDQPSSSHCQPCLQTCSCLLTGSPIPQGSISLLSNPLHVVSVSWPLGVSPWISEQNPKSSLFGLTELLFPWVLPPIFQAPVSWPILHILVKVTTLTPQGLCLCSSLIWISFPLLTIPPLDFSFIGILNQRRQSYCPHPNQGSTYADTLNFSMWYQS